jgi:hypothetical protein
MIRMSRHAADLGRRGAKSSFLLVALTVTVPCLVASAGAGTSPIPISVQAHTGIRLADVVWTGKRFLYVENTTNVVWAAGPRLRKFAAMPKIVEETRCRPSPGAHGFPPGAVYCHAPDNVIYRIDPGGQVNVFARLPDTQISDGALAFDTFGAFGFRLLAATGRSGSATPDGGAVYAVAASGAVSRIGAYSSSAKGGADQIVVAPPGFGTGSRQLVLTVDAGPHGALVMMDAHGRTREIATLPDGPNPIVAVPAATGHGKLAARRGLYVTDTNSTNVFFASAASLARYAGQLIVGTELKATFWAVAPHGRAFQARKIPLTPPGGNFNLEGATYVN